MSQRKCVWVVSEHYHPDLTSTGYFLTEIAEKLGRNYKVHVLCSSPHVVNKKRIKREEINGVSIRRIGLNGLNKNQLATRILRFIVLSFRMAGVLFFNVRKGDLLLVVTNPAPIILVSGLIKKIRKCKLIIIVHDVFPENLVSANLLSIRSLQYRALLRVFNWAYNCGDELITLGRDMRKVFMGKLPKFKGTLSVIPNWADPDLVSMDPNKDDWRSSYKMSDKLVFQFAGNLGRAQGVSFMLEAATKAPKNVGFLFFGSGVFKDRIQEGANFSDRIFYGGVFSREESNIYLKKCDVAVVSLEPGMTGLGVPSKTYNILAAGKPILYIGDEESEIGLLISEYNLGIICEPGNVSSILKGIGNFLNLGEVEVTNMGIRARKLAEGEYSKSSILNNYSSVVRRHLR